MFTPYYYYFCTLLTYYEILNTLFVPQIDKHMMKRNFIDKLN